MDSISTTLNASLAVLSAMITPAVLISACGSVLLSTSTRLGRVVDRVRVLSDKMEELAHAEESDLELVTERRRVVFVQLDKLTSRARLLQRTMTIIYLALAIFVATSVAIGVVAVTDVAYSFVPVIFGLFGAALLSYASVLLIFETRLARQTIRAEMDFIWYFTKHFAPTELVERNNRKGILRRLRRRREANADRRT